MKLSIEDPRLTAYALDEIEDANERAEIERAIATSPELQAVVAAIRETGDLLIAELAKENAPTLSEFDKARLSQCAQPKLIKRFAVNLRQHWHLVAGLAAACTHEPGYSISSLAVGTLYSSGGEVKLRLTRLRS